MIAQMNEQMQLLQNAAMTRIESLERELMEERRAREDLQEKVHRENSARSATKRIMPDSERNGEVEDNDDGDDPCDSSTGTPKTPINMKASRGRSTRDSISSMSSIDFDSDEEEKEEEEEGQNTPEAKKEPISSWEFGDSRI